MYHFWNWNCSAFPKYEISAQIVVKNFVLFSRRKKEKKKEKKKKKYLCSWKKYYIYLPCFENHVKNRKPNCWI